MNSFFPYFVLVHVEATACDSLDSLLLIALELIKPSLQAVRK